MPVFTTVKVHRDFHVEVAKSLYSVPGAYQGGHLDARADSQLVKLYHRGRLVKTHPRQPPGRRHTDREDLPEHKAEYALRDLQALIGACAGHGPNIGIYAERVLDDPLPWTWMRAVYRLLGLVRRYGPDPVETACARALGLDVISVTKIASMLQRATMATAGTTPATGGTAVATDRTTPATGGTAVATDRTTPATGGTTATVTPIHSSQPAAVTTSPATELKEEPS